MLLVQFPLGYLVTSKVCCLVRITRRVIEVELYRAADADTKKSAMAILKGEKEDMGDLLSTLMNNKTVKSVISGMLKK